MTGDALSDVLQAVRLSGAAFFRVEASPPWVAHAPPAQRVASLVLPQAQHVFEYHVVTEGSCWARVEGEPAVLLNAGDIVVLPHGDAHTLSSAPDLHGEADVEVFHEAARHPLPFSLNPGDPSRPIEARLVCGFLGCDARPFNPLLEALPRLLHVTAHADDFPLSQFMSAAVAESDHRRAGGQCVLARLSELMFVQVVRRHLQHLPPDRSGWLAGLRDPHIGRALTLLHGQVARDWTLPKLGREVGLSRSTLAERFNALVGQPPMQYLAQWRMQVAAGLLANGGSKVAAVAQQVGYDSEAAFSRAFKKATGVPPAAWRKTAAA
jgi:AraC-like DNA-binding protein